MPPLLKRSSYYNPDYRQSAALIRARRPYLFKNMATGIVIAAFAVSVFAFTFYAVGQDNFEDVKVPDAPAQPAKAPNVPVKGTAS